MPDQIKRIEEQTTITPRLSSSKPQCSLGAVSVYLATV